MRVCVCVWNLRFIHAFMHSRDFEKTGKLIAQYFAEAFGTPRSQRRRAHTAESSVVVLIWKEQGVACAI